MDLGHIEVAGWGVVPGSAHRDECLFKGSEIQQEWVLWVSFPRYECLHVFLSWGFIIRKNSGKQFNQQILQQIIQPVG